LAHGQRRLSRRLLKLQGIEDIENSVFHFGRGFIGIKNREQKLDLATFFLHQQKFVFSCLFTELNAVDIEASIHIWFKQKIRNKNRRIKTFLSQRIETVEQAGHGFFNLKKARRNL